MNTIAYVGPVVDDYTKLLGHSIQQPASGGIRIYQSLDPIDVTSIASRPGGQKRQMAYNQGEPRGKENTMSENMARYFTDDGEILPDNRPMIWREEGNQLELWSPTTGDWCHVKRIPCSHPRGISREEAEQIQAKYGKRSSFPWESEGHAVGFLQGRGYMCVPDVLSDSHKWWVLPEGKQQPDESEDNAIRFLIWRCNLKYTGWLTADAYRQRTRSREEDESNAGDDFSIFEQARKYEWRPSRSVEGSTYVQIENPVKVNGTVSGFHAFDGSEAEDACGAHMKQLVAFGREMYEAGMRHAESKGASDQGLTFRCFSHANRQRVDTTSAFENCREWESDDWLLAVVGEVGEAANKVKKIKRDHGDQPSLYDVAIEIADVITYADLTIQRLGFSTEEVLIKKFDEVSDRYGSSDKLGGMLSSISGRQEAAAQSSKALSEAREPNGSREGSIWNMSPNLDEARQPELSRASLPSKDGNTVYAFWQPRVFKDGFNGLWIENWGGLSRPGDWKIVYPHKKVRETCAGLESISYDQAARRLNMTAANMLGVESIYVSDLGYVRRKDGLFVQSDGDWGEDQYGFPTEDEADKAADMAVRRVGIPFVYARSK